MEGRRVGRDVRPRVLRLQGKLPRIQATVRWRLRPAHIYSIPASCERFGAELCIPCSSSAVTPRP